MPVINISVENKIAEADGTLYVCGNSDFVAKFAFDAEWEAYENKTARFCYNNSYVDVVFTGNECPVPIISGTYFFNIGVYAGNLHTTTPARVPCKKSILCDTGFPADPPNDVYNQIMAKLNSLGSADPEAIAKAVADYLAAHPIEETDPTVPEWAKAETKPTYTADEVGAISQDDLQTATNNALAQAKASGEFDGSAGAPGKDGAGMDITGAAIGQIAKISAVDESGVPTAWSPVDMPTGGGGGELILDYIHDDSKFPPGRPAIHPIAYDADTKVWTSDGSIDLTTIAAAGTAVNGRYQINIIDPLLQINGDFDRTKWNPIGTFVLTILSANTFSTGDYVPPVIAADWSKYIMISSETVTINMPSNASDKIRMVFDGQFLGATHYTTFGMTEWFDPNSRTTVSNEIGYQQRRGIYNHIVCDFDLENGKIYGTVSQAFVSYDKIGSAYGVYYPSAATTWPQIVLSRYARLGYIAIPYKGRLRIYNRG